MFDYSFIQKNKSRDYLKNSEFFKFIYMDLIDRTNFITTKKSKILWINHSNLHEMHLIKNNSMDCIYFPFGMHWISDVPKFLSEIKSLMTKNGIFICNFAGGESLLNLRKTLYLAHEATNTHQFPHISPFIRFEDVTSLLAQVGFVENIVDHELLTFEYNSPISFMKALKKAGESNALKKRTHYSLNKGIYQFLNKKNFQPFTDQVNLITVVASKTKNSIKLQQEYFSKQNV